MNSSLKGDGVPLVKAFVLSCSSATPKAPRQCKYIKSTLDNKQKNRPKPMMAVYNIPL